MSRLMCQSGRMPMGNPPDYSNRLNVFNVVLHVLHFKDSVQKDQSINDFAFGPCVGSVKYQSPKWVASFLTIGRYSQKTTINGINDSLLLLSKIKLFLIGWSFAM